MIRQDMIVYKNTYKEAPNVLEETDAGEVPSP